MPTVIKVPYEFMVRWREGKMSGAHVGWSLLVTSDDGTTREIPGNVEPVDIGKGKGFPLDEILEKLHIDALTAIDLKVAENAAKDEELAAERAKAEAEKAAVIEAKDTELAAKSDEHAAELAAQLADKDAELSATVATLDEERSAREAKEVEAAELALKLAAAQSTAETLAAEIKRLQVELNEKEVE